MLSGLSTWAGWGIRKHPCLSTCAAESTFQRSCRKARFPVTILRAATIMGSGSASYEIIKHLVKKIPVINVPKWANTRCQPIAIRDVIKYLVGCLENPATAGKSFDIGGQRYLDLPSDAGDIC